MDKNFTKYDLDSKALWLIILAPLPITVIFLLLIYVNGTRQIVAAMLVENSVVELLTFIVLVAAGTVGFKLVIVMKRDLARSFDCVFVTLFSVALVLIAMEEIAWGQWFFGFTTPRVVADQNAQGELTLHNLVMWHDYIEVLPLLFGTGGLIGIVIGSRSFLVGIAPSGILAVWFLTISFISAIDFYHEFAVHSYRLFSVVNRLDELMELFVAASAFLYLWLIYIARSPEAYRPCRKIIAV